MSSEKSNVVSLVKTQREDARSRRAILHDLVRSAIAEADCECDALFGASAGEIERACVSILSQMYEIGDPRNAAYTHLLSSHDDENLAIFIGAISADVLALHHAADPTFDRDKARDQCLVNARRMVGNPEYDGLADE